VTNLSYVVGDSALASWYNAGDFGNGNLNNNDVNNAFYASLGLFVPHPFTDAFDAMDAYPEDTVGSVGGDGQIRFLDWQVILQRSLRQKTDNWTRSWAAGGVRLAASGTLNIAANLPGEELAPPPPGAVWVRHGKVDAGTIENAEPGALVQLPVYVTVAEGEKLSGFQFLATITGSAGAPSLPAPAQFVLAEGIPSSRPVDAPAPNQVAYAWDLGTFDPPLEGRHLLGHVQFNVPTKAAKGQVYTLRFSAADGAPDLSAQYAFETLPACVWVRCPAAKGPEAISDEWKLRFFGSLDNPLALPDADPDEDGAPNWKEYMWGTDPNQASSRLRLVGPEARFRGKSREFLLKWLTAPGKRYVLEACADLVSDDWKVLATDLPGDGNFQEFIDSNLPDGSHRFYRVRLK
jgi:hypothetical protein